MAVKMIAKFSCFGPIVPPDMNSTNCFLYGSMLPLNLSLDPWLRAGDIRSKSDHRATHSEIFAMFHRLSVHDLFPAFSRWSLPSPFDQLCTYISNAQINGFGKKVIFAAKVLVETSVSQAWSLHQLNHAGPVHTLRTKLTRSALHNSTVGPFLVMRRITHTG